MCVDSQDYPQPLKCAYLLATEMWKRYLSPQGARQELAVSPGAPLVACFYGDRNALREPCVSGVRTRYPYPVDKIEMSLQEAY